MIDEPEIDAFYWEFRPGGNVDHIAENGITPADIEEVYSLGPSFFPNRRNPDGLIMLGTNAGGRHLLAAVYPTFEPGVWVAGTAYWIDGDRAQRYIERGYV